MPVWYMWFCKVSYKKYVSVVDVVEMKTDTVLLQSSSLTASDQKSRWTNNIIDIKIIKIVKIFLIITVIIPSMPLACDDRVDMAEEKGPSGPVKVYETDILWK